MKNKLVFYIGISGVVLFVGPAILGGLLIENYSITRQYISETYAIDTEYGWILRVFGFIPSGILISLFCFQALRFFEPGKWIKIGFYGIGVFYGFASILVAVFPCDSGCNREWINPSASQIIHNFSGLMTYLLVPICIILIGFGLSRVEKTRFSLLSKLIGASSIFFVVLLFSNADSNWVGVYQRMVELSFLIWVLLCAFHIRNKVSLKR